MPAPAIDWQAMVFDPAWMAFLDRLALRRFSQPGLAEEASTHVIQRLSEDNWAMCQQYSGQAKPETYLQTLTQNLLEEFSRKRFGRPRPPEWLKREGDLWVRLWKMVCLERQAVPTVIDKLHNEIERSRELLQQAITTIKSRLPWCGSSNREIPADSLCTTEEDPNPELIDQDLETQLDQHNWEGALHLLFELLLSEDCPSESIREELNHKLDTLRASLKLDAQERLLLKMAYQEGLKMNVIADALNMPRYQPGRLLKGIHGRIQKALIDAGINSEGLTFHD
ncbi:MAG: hypothetical protein K6L73_07295 [Cellvibrionaceae bacterium]